MLRLKQLVDACLLRFRFLAWSHLSCICLGQQLAFYKLRTSAIIIIRVSNSNVKQTIRGRQSDSTARTQCLRVHACSAVASSDLQSQDSERARQQAGHIATATSAAKQATASRIDPSGYRSCLLLVRRVLAHRDALQCTHTERHPSRVQETVLVRLDLTICLTSARRDS